MWSISKVSVPEEVHRVFSVPLLFITKGCPTLLVPWTTAHQPSLSSSIDQTLFKFTSIESVMQSNHLILCCPLLFLLSIFPSAGIFSNGSSHQVAKVLELQLCRRASSNETIHTKALVDLVFEDCFRKWQSSENIDSKSNLNGFFNLVDNFSKYYLRWERGLSKLLLNCHSQSGSSCTSQPNTISDVGLELSKFKGNCVLFTCSVKIVMSLEWVNGTFVTNNRNWRVRTY